MQSGPRRQVEKEGVAGVFGEFKLNPGVESIQMYANHSRRPKTIAGGERALIQRGEPAVRHSHLVVQCDRTWCGRPVPRGKEIGSVAANGRKVHDSSVVLRDVRPLRTYLPRIGAPLCRVKRVGFYALTVGGQAKRMTKRTARLYSRAKRAHSAQKFIFAHRFSTGSARLIDIFSTG